MDIQIISEINLENYADFSRQMAELESEAGRQVIEVELASGGGDALAALAYYDRIRKSPCTVHIHARGIAGSAAVLIFAAGDFRIMSRTAWVMVHEDSYEIEGSVTDHEKAALANRRIENQWNHLMALRTNTSASKWSALHKAESWLNAKQCKLLGLVEEIC